MDVNIYCNHSGDYSRRYVVFGGLWVRKSFLHAVEKSIADFGQDNRTFFPFRWDRVNHNNWETYRDFSDLFFLNVSMKFRAMILDLVATGTRKDRLKEEEFCGTLYYHLFFETLRSQHRYHVYLNRKAHPFHRELKVLVHCVNAHYRKQEGMKEPIVRSVALFGDDQCVIWPLLDLFTEALNASWEENLHNAGQFLLCDHIAHRVGWEDLHETSSHENVFEQKFGVWTVHLRKSRRDQLERVRQLKLNL